LQNFAQFSWVCRRRSSWNQRVGMVKLIGTLRWLQTEVEGIQVL
jgi:hypothetical protein